MPGLKVVLQATPFDAKGLLKAVLRDDNSEVFFEDKLNWRDVGFVPSDDPVRCIAARNVPTPFSPLLEDQTVPTVESVADATRRAARGEEF